MKKDHILIIIVCLVIGVIIFYSFQDGETEESYTKEIVKERKTIHDFMVNSDESPIPKEERESFEGLIYYPVKMDFRIKARYNPVKETETLTIPTSTGKEEKYRKAGYASFKLDEKEQNLLLLEVEEGGDDTLFLAFADETSGDETYGGGRYINVSKPTGSVVTIDFNLAYNPYCAYNEKFSCPLPPRENILSVAITAGEKDFKKQP